MLAGKPFFHRQVVKSLASRRLWVLPGLRAEHRRADRTLPTLSTKAWCSSKRGFGIWCLCEVRGCSGAKVFQVVEACREVGGVGFRD